MDVNNSLDGGAKKVPLEDLSKEDLIKKCRYLLLIAQKAKQSKDVVIEENNNLKEKLRCSAATDELIDNLTQQKLALVTDLEELKGQRRGLHDRLTSCEEQLHQSENKLGDLDTENQSFKRQVVRLTEENEQLLTHLDVLEKQIEDLKQIGLVQQDQLLRLEKNNELLANEKDAKGEGDQEILELQNMLSVSLEEIKKLKTENKEILDKLENKEILIQEKDKNIITISEELTEKSSQMQSLQDEVDTLKTELENDSSTINEEEVVKLKGTLNEYAESIQVYQQEIEVKNKELEKHSNVTDDLTTEIHKNRALIEKLNQDLTNKSNKLKDNQIVSSGLTTDLQNTNEKMKDKLKIYHTKIVKFAGDVKKLKDTKEYILDNFKTYNDQVKLWKEQLVVVTKKLTLEINNSEKEKLKLKEEIIKLTKEISSSDNEKLNMKEEIDELNSQIAKLTDDNKREKLSEEKNESETNSKLISENKELNDKINSLFKKVDKLKADLNDMKINVKEDVKVIANERDKDKEEFVKAALLYQEEINALQNLIAKLKDDLSVSSKQHKHNQNTTLENEKFKEEINLLNLKLQESNKYKTELLTENENYNKTIQDDKAIIDENTKLIAELKRAIEKLENDVENLKTTETKLAEQSSQEIMKLSSENNELRERNESLTIKVEELLSNLSTTNLNNTTVIELEEKVNSLKRENTELLTEMNEMNQALKERGETISKQQAYCDEVLKKISIYESQANKNIDTISQNNERIKMLEEEICQLKSDCKDDSEVLQLRSEITALKDKLNNSLDNSQECNYADSETLSTSTISRADEASRLKDLEGSWEERYGKLRTLALKLKGRIRELTVELTKEQNEKSELQVKLATSVKTIQTTQLQCDTLQDELEAFKNDNKTYSKKLDSLAVEISKDKNELALKEEIISNLKGEVEGMKKEKSDVENWKKQVGLKVKTLKNELEANTVMKKEFESQIQKLKNELESKEKSLKDEVDKHLQTKNSLQESTNECKKQSVLNLEMQDYERGIKDVSQKLEKKNELVTKLKNQIDSQKSSVNAFKEQNRLLEDRTRSLENEVDAYRIEVNAFKKNVCDLETLISEKDLKIQEVMKTLEDTRSENEELNTQLSKVIAEHQKTNHLLKNEKDLLRSQNLGLEQRLREVEDKLRIKEDELSNIRAEFQGYKVRAQSVLRQNQSRDVGIEEKLTEEAATLKAQVDILKAEIEELRSSVDELKTENNELKLKKEEIEALTNKLNGDLEESKKGYERVNAKYQQSIMDNAETVRGLKVHADTLAQCYRQQISEQEVRHNREIIELQSKLEKGASTPDVPSLILPTTPREEGEGSESVDSTNGNIHPLEKLLGADQDHEMSLIKKQLGENESKVTHLTALLADTEQDLAKHVQMNKVLKEEIRRQQRSVEREKHAENLEYMKNVVFKFITLGNGDERQRLVPVLNTILKLSPEETQKLNMVAKGDRSWSTYLPLWSSTTSKPQ